MSDWTSVNGNWSIFLGKVLQTDVFGNGTIPTTPLPGNVGQQGAILFLSTTSITNGYIEVRMKSTDNRGMGIVARYTDIDNYYLFDWYADPTVRRLLKRVNGNNVFITGDEGISYNFDQFYYVRFSFVNSFLEIKVNNVVILSGEDGSHSDGFVGFYTWQSQGVYFDDVEIAVFQ